MQKVCNQGHYPVDTNRTGDIFDPEEKKSYRGQRDEKP